MKDAFGNEIVPGDQVVTIRPHIRALVKAKVISRTPTGMISCEIDGSRYPRDESEVFFTGVHLSE